MKKLVAFIETSAKRIAEIRQKIKNGICSNHTGKMKGMRSFSTSTLLNERCQKNARIKGAVCENCYAVAVFKRYRNMRGKYELNTELMCKYVYPVECFPKIDDEFFRFESFGDLSCVTQALNYFHFCLANPGTTFAIFTKNPDILAKALKYEDKPSNLIVIYSSLFLNEITKKIMEMYPFIDKVFTVFTEDFIKENGIEINCGARCCRTCLQCYHRDNGIVFINEKLK